MRRPETRLGKRKCFDKVFNRPVIYQLSKNLISNNKKVGEEITVSDFTFPNSENTFQ